MSSWKGRFRERLHPEALRFSSSLDVDKRLFGEDIEGSIAHVSMLAKQKILSSFEAKKIRNALRSVGNEIKKGKLKLDGFGTNGRFVAEDIHMAIENRLTQKVGAIGGKLHTARSRNDQVALDVRLYLRKEITGIVSSIRKLQKTFLSKADRQGYIVMPGYTHLQQAQPVLLAHHFLAYVEMLQRDAERFSDCLRRVQKSPLGAGALAGTPFPIDRNYTAKALGFEGIVENSIDAVADRDVHIEFLSASAITMMHLSRFAEELVLWSSSEWHFAEIGDAFTTGSSIMPQKKNPDMAELIRGKTGRVYGNLVALLTIMKGLPLAYNRDMQEDKEPLFDSSATLAGCLQICALMLQSVKFNKQRFTNDRQSDLLLATELADYLVRKGMPFRKAHAVVGEIVNVCVRKKVSFKELSLKEYQRHSELFTRDIWKILDLRASLQNKKSAGSTSPKEVAAALRRWKKSLRSKS
ncbi:MAG TPA: argininosuccinate lyase [Bacteroidota bacterium]|jgi:argininosuccinate lyase|nr:argininosuccinate lyase [Bacteroidota bacterium]